MIRHFAAVAVLAALAAPPVAAVTSYTSAAAFSAAVVGDYTLVNLDASPFAGFASGYRVDDTGPAAAVAAVGLDFVTINPRVVGGQDHQLTTPGRDRLLLNGPGFDGDIVIDFAVAIDSFGVAGNPFDGGLITAYAGAGATGVVLGTAAMSFPGNAVDGFGGLTVAGPIGSVKVSCIFNSDLRCGLFDFQFGTANAAVPEPATWIALTGGFGIIGTALRRRRGLAMAR